MKQTIRERFAEWWAGLHSEQRMTFYLLILGAVVLAALVLFSGCVATTEFVRLEGTRQEAIITKAMWGAFAHVEAERKRLAPDNKAAPALRLMAMANAAAIEVPPPTSDTAGVGGMIMLAGTVLAAVGFPAGGVMLKRAGSKLVASERKRYTDRRIMRKLIPAAKEASAVADPKDIAEAEEQLNGGTA